MATGNQLTAEMTISLNHRLYQVESVIKGGSGKGGEPVTAKLRDLATGDVIEKKIKPSDTIREVILEERTLEFLYPEEGGFLCLDVISLDRVLIDQDVVGEAVNYLKEGVEFKGFFHGDTPVVVQLPPFLELMVAEIEEPAAKKKQTDDHFIATLETGARVVVPRFIEAGDIVKVNTVRHEYVQRI